MLTIQPTLTIYITIILILAACTLVLMAPLSLNINTREHRYVLSLAWLFQIQYGCPEHPGCLRFSLPGCSWVRKLRWPVAAFDQKGLKRLGGLVMNEREPLGGALLKAKDAWDDLLRLSVRKLEINLCTPDFMANALLSLVLSGLFANRKYEGIRISVNYLEENWLIACFTVRLWAAGWISAKFAFSGPVSRLGVSIIRSLLK
ncbi:MAG: hypothetical protein AB1847_15970 [bacterium]